LKAFVKIQALKYKHLIKFLPFLCQRGPTTFDLRAILQKRDNLRATSKKCCI